MIITKLAYVAILASGVCFVSGGSQAQDARPHEPLHKAIGVVTPTGPVPTLAVINSTGATLENGKLKLSGVSPSAVLFADRPVRSAGHVKTDQFIMQWDEGKNSFAKDPPNATVSILGGDGSKVSDAVVTLKSPKLEGNDLTFDVSVLEGSLDGSKGPAALFIDDFSTSGRNFSSGRSAGAAPVDAQAVNGHDRTYWHAPVLHGAWYASTLPSIGAEAALGAGDAQPAPVTTCVDTPFQVCY